MTKFLILIAMFISFACTVFGCRQIRSPLSKFDTGQFVFLGRVEEVIESEEYESQGKTELAIGLKIKVTDGIYPSKITDTVSVFIFRLTPSCGAVADKEEVINGFPIGSEVRVVAREATILKTTDEQSPILKLEVSPGNAGHIARNDLDENIKTSTYTHYDYGSHVKKDYSHEERFLLNSLYFLPAFELRKDWVRLEISTSEEEQFKILERLVLYPRFYDVNFPALVKTYLKDEVSCTKLIEKWNSRKAAAVSKSM